MASNQAPSSQDLCQRRRCRCLCTLRHRVCPKHSGSATSLSSCRHPQASLQDISASYAVALCACVVPEPKTLSASLWSCHRLQARFQAAMHLLPGHVWSSATAPMLVSPLAESCCPASSSSRHGLLLQPGPIKPCTCYARDMVCTAGGKGQMMENSTATGSLTQARHLLQAAQQLA